MGKWPDGMTYGHGTNARYTKHRRENDPACAACKEAHANYNKWRQRELRSKKAEEEASGE